MPEHAPYYNEDPIGDDFADPASPEASRAEFAKRLYRAMLAKGWNQSELARQAALHTADGKFGRDNVSSYVRGKAMPGPKHLHALCQALGVQPREILPHAGLPSADKKPSSASANDMGNGKMWLKVDQAVDWDTGLEVLRMLKTDASRRG